MISSLYSFISVCVCVFLVDVVCIGCTKFFSSQFIAQKGLAHRPGKVVGTLAQLDHSSESLLPAMGEGLEVGENPAFLKNYPVVFLPFLRHHSVVRESTNPVTGDFHSRLRASLHKVEDLLLQQGEVEDLGGGSVDGEALDLHDVVFSASLRVLVLEAIVLRTPTAELCDVGLGASKPTELVGEATQEGVDGWLVLSTARV